MIGHRTSEKHYCNINSLINVYSEIIYIYICDIITIVAAAYEQTFIQCSTLHSTEICDEIKAAAHIHQTHQSSLFASFCNISSR